MSPPPVDVLMLPHHRIRENAGRVKRSGPDIGRSKSAPAFGLEPTYED
jgi:hypothetical protein